MAFDGGVVAGQGHVAEGFGLKQVVEHGQQVVAMVVPAEVEHLRQGIHLGDRQLWQQTERKKNSLKFWFKMKQALFLPTPRTSTTRLPLISEATWTQQQRQNKLLKA